MIDVDTPYPKSTINIHSTQMPFFLYMMNTNYSAQRKLGMQQFLFVDFAIKQVIKPYVNTNQLNNFCPFMEIVIDVSDKGIIVLSSKLKEYEFDFDNSSSITTDENKNFSKLAKQISEILNNNNKVLAIGLSYMYDVQKNGENINQSHVTSIFLEQKQNNVYGYHFEPNGRGGVMNEQAKLIDSYLRKFFKMMETHLNKYFDKVVFALHNATPKYQTFHGKYVKYCEDYDTGFCFGLSVFWFVSIITIMCELSLYCSKNKIPAETFFGGK